MVWTYRWLHFHHPLQGARIDLSVLLFCRTSPYEERGYWKPYAPPFCRSYRCLQLTSISSSFHIQSVRPNRVGARRTKLRVVASHYFRSTQDCGTGTQSGTEVSQIEATLLLLPVRGDSVFYSGFQENQGLDRRSGGRLSSGQSGQVARQTAVQGVSASHGSGLS